MKNKPDLSFIDILAGNCSQQCQQCFYTEDTTNPLGFEKEAELIERISREYPEAQLHIYPKEITSGLRYLPFFAKFGQKSVLSNGKNLDDKVIAELKKVGIEEVKITLFATPTQQEAFNGNTETEYQQITDAIKRSRDNGLNVWVFNVIDKETTKSVEELCEKCADLGANKVQFMRLTPIGNASSLDPSRIIDQTDLEEMIPKVEAMRKKYPQLYTSFNIKFGINFYGKTIEQAREKIKRSLEGVTPTPYSCLAVGNQFVSVSLPSQNVYWCFFMISDPEAKIGTIDKTGRITLDSQPDLTIETLKKELKGNCSSDNCEYQELCMGGCRMSAYTMAKLKGEKDPLYAEADICLTRSYKKVYGKSRVD